MTGIELLQMIKNYEIKEGAEINVLRVNEDYCCFDVVAKLKYRIMIYIGLQEHLEVLCYGIMSIYLR